MNVAILVPTFHSFSGIDRVAEKQARQFALAGDHVTIFTFETNMQPPQGVKLRVIGLPRNSLGQRCYRLFFPLDIFKAAIWVPRLKEFDVIYSHQYPMTWLAYLSKRLYGTKYVYYNHGIAPTHTFSNLIERTYRKIEIPLANWTIRRADSGISVSRYLQTQLRKDTGLASQVIYNTIDAERFNPRVDASLVRQRHNLDGSPVILFVGRISPHKGVHLLIEAFNLAKQHTPSAKLVIVGKHTFRAYASKLQDMSDDAVIFVQDVTDEELPQYYAACDVYATASLWEGFDLPLAEAQACGKPVVAFDIGPHPEVMAEEQAGRLLQVKDTNAMAKAIIHFLNHTQGSLGTSP